MTNLWIVHLGARHFCNGGTQLATWTKPCCIIGSVFEFVFYLLRSQNIFIPRNSQEPSVPSAGIGISSVASQCFAQNQLQSVWPCFDFKQYATNVFYINTFFLSKVSVTSIASPCIAGLALHNSCSNHLRGVWGCHGAVMPAAAINVTPTPPDRLVCKKCLLSNSY